MDEGNARISLFFASSSSLSFASFVRMKPEMDRLIKQLQTSLNKHRKFDKNVQAYVLEWGQLYTSNDVSQWELLLKLSIYF